MSLKELTSRSSKTAIIIAVLGFLSALVPGCIGVITLVLERTLPPPPEGAVVYEENARIEGTSDQVTLFNPDGTTVYAVDEEGTEQKRHIAQGSDGEYVEVVKSENGKWHTQQALDFQAQQVEQFTPQFKGK